jgi:hypothetical protein
MEFCEDASRFLPKSAVREFVSDVPSSFVIRYAVASDSPYAAEFKSEATASPLDFTRVAYRPERRLAI